MILPKGGEDGKDKDGNALRAWRSNIGCGLTQLQEKVIGLGDHVANTTGANEDRPFL